MDLQKKVGPLPIWGYGAIALGAGAILFWRSRKNMAQPSDLATANTTPITGDSIDPSTGLPYNQEYTGSESSPYGPTGSTTNNYYYNTAPTPATRTTPETKPPTPITLIPRIVAGKAIPPGYSLLHGVLTPNSGTKAGSLPSGWRWAGKTAIPPGYTLVHGILKKAA